MIPYVVVHNAVSADGRMDSFKPDVGLYNFLALIWKPDIMLTSSNTILTWFNNEQKEDTSIQNKQVTDSKIEKGRQDGKQILAVVDSNGRVKVWQKLKETNHWKDTIAICSETTPKDHIQFLEQNQVKYIIAGKAKVDMYKALEMLNAEFGAEVVRVDSGGTLNGVLFRQGLVNEVSMLIYPLLVGGESPKSIFTAKDLVSSEDVIKLELIESRKVRENLIWIRYAVKNKQ